MEHFYRLVEKIKFLLSLDAEFVLFILGATYLLFD